MEYDRRNSLPSSSSLIVRYCPGLKLTNSRPSSGQFKTILTASEVSWRISLIFNLMKEVVMSNEVSGYFSRKDKVCQGRKFCFTLVRILKSKRYRLAHPFSCHSGL